MANLLLLTGRRIGGEEALHIGLADAMADPEDLLEAAISLATEIAENAPLAVESTRSLLREDLVARVRAQTSRESHIQLVLKDTEDFHEGVRAVKEKHKGNWKRR
jgi:enoyl-CoA hydratase/carnithine racemase